MIRRTTSPKGFFMQELKSVLLTLKDYKFEGTLCTVDSLLTYLRGRNFTSMILIENQDVDELLIGDHTLLLAITDLYWLSTEHDEQKPLLLGRGMAELGISRHEKLFKVYGPVRKTTFMLEVIIALTIISKGIKHEQNK